MFVFNCGILCANRVRSVVDLNIPVERSASHRIFLLTAISYHGTGIPSISYYAKVPKQIRKGHSMKDYILAKLNDLKAKSGKSYEAVHEHLGYAVSTVHRWHRGESEPDLDQLTNLVEFYGGDMAHLFEVVGRQEIAASQSNGYQGIASMAESYEARLKAKDEQIQYMQEELRWLRSVVDALTHGGGKYVL